MHVICGMALARTSDWCSDGIYSLMLPCNYCHTPPPNHLERWRAVLSELGGIDSICGEEMQRMRPPRDIRDACHLLPLAEQCPNQIALPPLC